MTMLYKEIYVWEKINSKHAIRYTCFELLETNEYVVQTADYFYEEGSMSSDFFHRQQVELFLEDAPEERMMTAKTIKEAINVFAKHMGCFDDDKLEEYEVVHKKQIFDRKERMCLQKIQDNQNDALLDLANLYKENNMQDKAQKYYLEAVKNGVNEALNDLGVLYIEVKKYEEAKKYLLKAVNKNDSRAMSNLAYLYEIQNDLNKAKEHYLMAIKNGFDEALNSLGTLYFNQKDYNKAQEYY